MTVFLWLCTHQKTASIFFACNPSSLSFPSNRLRHQKIPLLVQPSFFNIQVWKVIGSESCHYTHTQKQKTRFKSEAHETKKNVISLLGIRRLLDPDRSVIDYYFSLSLAYAVVTLKRSKKSYSFYWNKFSASWKYHSFYFL